MVDEVIEQAFSAALDPMLIVDDAQRVVDANDATSHLFGYERDELTGHKLEDIIAPRHRPRLAPAWTEFLLAGAARAEWLMQSRDGELIEVEASGAAEISPGRHLFVLRDITGRKRAEAEAIRRADQQEAVANIGRVALTDVAGPALMQLAAEEIARVLGTEMVSVFELQAAGRDLALRAGTGFAEGTFGDDTIAGTASKGAFVIAAKEPVLMRDLATEDRFEVPPLLREHGAVSGVSVAIEGAERPFGVICASTRDRREFTADDLHFVTAVANVLGAALARERLRRLEVQLEQSRRMESIGQLAGGIAHDFNNLLGVITSYASFALDELDPKSQLHRDIGEVVTAAEHGADLTKQLLLFASRQVVQTRTVDPNELIRGASAILDRALGAHVELRTSLADEIPPVRLGHGQLEQILMNLAMNARDAMPEGGVLTIETELVDGRSEPEAPRDADGRFIRLRVEDTGTGMSEEIARQAFEPFFTTKDRSQGTGLGLATVYGVAQAAGGWVRIDSEPGRGTTIKVYVPATGEAAPADVAATPSRLQGFGERVLLVEDDSTVRRATRRILEQNGYQVETAQDAAEALARAGGDFDLLLTNVVMPGLSGTELAARIRAERPELPIVFISGYAESALPAGEELTAHAQLIEKPFTDSALLAGLRAALNVEAAADDEPASAA